MTGESRWSRDEPGRDPRCHLGVDFVAESNIVDRQIRSLRIKLQNDYRNPRFIATVAGVGYRFMPTSPRGLRLVDPARRGVLGRRMFESLSASMPCFSAAFRIFRRARSLAASLSKSV